MVNNIQGVLKYAFTHPTRKGGTWRGWCAGFVQSALGIGAVGNAVDMLSKARAAGRLVTDKNPPVGALVFYGGTSKALTHVVISLGSQVVLGTSAPMGKPREWDGFNSVGIFRIDEYKGMKYQGWTDYASGITLPTGADSGPEFFREWQAGILRDVGYNDLVDNFPLYNTYRAIQRAGATPARDGWPGAVTWRNFMTLLGW
jgi:hypothetical protein